MIYKIITVVLIIFLIVSCGIINRAGDKTARAVFITLPDACDLQLINQIISNHYNYKDTTNNSDSSIFLLGLDKKCREDYNYIDILTYSNDSLDLSVVKQINDSILEINRIYKKFRIKFINDSTNEINLLYGNSINDNENKIRPVIIWEKGQ